MITPILYTYKAKLVRVIDADTVILELDRGFGDYSIKTVRLAGIDAPELRGKDKEKGIKAKEWVDEKLKDKQITIQSLKLDSFGRAIAKIWYWDKDKWISLNDKLVKNRLAVPYRKDI